jgi:hypothetical protein
MLECDPKVSATVVLQHPRRDGYAGGITILKEHLAKVRPSFLAARTFQRTSYLPGEISQMTGGTRVGGSPVGKGSHREAFGLVATLPHSAAHAAVFTFGRTIGDLLPAAPGCFKRLGGAPEKVVCDNDTAIVAERRGGEAILHDEVAAFFGRLGTRVVVLRAGDPQAKGRSSGPTATWNARSCRCGSSPICSTCSPSTSAWAPNPGSHQQQYSSPRHTLKVGGYKHSLRTYEDWDYTLRLAAESLVYRHSGTEGVVVHPAGDLSRQAQLRHARDELRVLRLNYEIARNCHCC